MASAVCLAKSSVKCLSVCLVCLCGLWSGCGSSTLVAIASTVLCFALMRSLCVQAFHHISNLQALSCPAHHTILCLPIWLSEAAGLCLQIWDTFMDYIEPYSSRAPYMISIGRLPCPLSSAPLTLREVASNLPHLGSQPLAPYPTPGLCITMAGCFDNMRICKSL